MIFIGGLAACFVGSSLAQPNPSSEQEALSYVKVAAERAGKIVANLGLSDGDQASRVREVIAIHYSALRAIHDPRDAQIKAIKAASGNADSKASAIQRVRDEADLKLYQLHFEFVARLSAELSSEQVEKVKNGLTYGVLPLTYRGYQEMYPLLSDAQKKQLLAWLTEAREHAMDGGSSEEKHSWFGKYKGRINNYLSAAGFDAKKAEADLNSRQKTGAGNSDPAHTSPP